MAFERKKIAVALSLALGGGGAIVGAAPALAQDIRVEVTGSSIRRVDAETALPVTIVTREEIAQTGVNNVEQLLRELAVEALSRLATDPHVHAVFEILFHKCELTGELADRSVERSEQRTRCVTTIERLVRQAIEQRQLPADTDPMLTARLLHAGVLGLMHEWVAAPDEFDLARVAPALVDAMIAGVRAAPPRGARI